MSPNEDSVTYRGQCHLTRTVSSKEDSVTSSGHVRAYTLKRQAIDGGVNPLTGVRADTQGRGEQRVKMSLYGSLRRLGLPLCWGMGAMPFVQCAEVRKI